MELAQLFFGEITEGCIFCVEGIADVDHFWARDEAGRLSVLEVRRSFATPGLEHLALHSQMLLVCEAGIVCFQFARRGMTQGFEGVAKNTGMRDVNPQGSMIREASVTKGCAATGDGLNALSNPDAVDRSAIIIAIVSGRSAGVWVQIKHSFPQTQSSEGVVDLACACVFICIHSNYQMVAFRLPLYDLIFQIVAKSIQGKSVVAHGAWDPLALTERRSGTV